ncbi:MAG: hypothetical protein QME57_01475 [Patescibacteria group bacterium]|nr:hypothetical protein [Patescibacteria group bacterium]
MFLPKFILFILATVLMLIFCFAPILTCVHAGQLENISDTMSRLKREVLANHTIQFTTPSGVGAGETITITFPSAFDMNSIDYTDIDLEDDGVDLDLAASATGTTWGVNVTGQVITFTNGSTPVASSSVLKIEIGTNALYQHIGDRQIINPSIEGTQIINIGGTFGDSGSLAVVILDDDQVIVTAQVEPMLTFSISPLATSTLLGGANSASTDTIKQASTTSIPFGVQIINQGTILGQQITVTTNAGNGYIATLQQNQDLTSGPNHIDPFIGTNASPQKWEDSTHPDGTTANINTGWFGYTTSDETLSTGTPGRFGTGADAADYWAGFTMSNTPYEIAFNDTSVNNETTNIGFKLEVNGYQPPGNYGGTILTYICTALY